MYRYVAIITIILVVEQNVVIAPPPLRLTIDCGSDERDSTLSSAILKSNSEDPFTRKSVLDVGSFCKYIHNAIPKAVKDGKFVLIESDSDQTGFSDTQFPIAITPPKDPKIPKLGLPRLKLPRLKIPKIKVPVLKNSINGSLKAPRIGSSSFSFINSEEESSLERMEKFKKGVQKMLHVVKVLGQLDQYLSERTRILVEKLSKTFAD